MIRLVLDSIAAGYEQDIRELVQAFYPGEEFEIRTPEGVHFSNTTQEEKNALKRARVVPCRAPARVLHPRREA